MLLHLQKLQHWGHIFHDHAAGLKWLERLVSWLHWSLELEAQWKDSKRRHRACGKIASRRWEIPRSFSGGSELHKTRANPSKDLEELDRICTRIYLIIVIIQMHFELYDDTLYTCTYCKHINHNFQMHKKTIFGSKNPNPCSEIPPSGMASFPQAAMLRRGSQSSIDLAKEAQVVVVARSFTFTKRNHHVCYRLKFVPAQKWDMLVTRSFYDVDRKLADEGEVEM